jgi:hypothetical protein
VMDDAARIGCEDHVGLWENELRDWLPDRLFDAHVHIGPPHIVERPTPERFREALCTFMSMRWETLAHIYSELFSGKTVQGQFAFPFPQREVDLHPANGCLINLAAREPDLAGFLLSHPTDTDATISDYQRAQAAGVRVAGIKPYADRLGKSNFDATMPEFIPDALLEFMASERLIMMLHTAGIGVGDKACRDYLRTTSQRHPDVRIILAHMGRYTCPDQFTSLMESGLLEHAPSLYLEMSSVTSQAVYEQVLRKPELRKRLLFGTDLPFGLITGVERWSDTHGAVFLTRDDYTWSDHEMNAEFAEERLQLTHNTYHVIKAFKDALDAIDLPQGEAETVKHDVFCANALRLLST